MQGTESFIHSSLFVGVECAVEVMWLYFQGIHFVNYSTILRKVVHKG